MGTMRSDLAFLLAPTSEYKLVMLSGAECSQVLLGEESRKEEIVFLVP